MKKEFCSLKRLSILIVFFLCSSQSVMAKHIVGGDMTYRCIPNSNPDMFTLEVTVTMYRDAYQGGDPQTTEFDNEIIIGAFRNTSGNPITFGVNSNFRYFDESAPTRLNNVLDITPNVDPCFRDVIEISTDAGIYITRLELPISEESYLLAYQRCCRNAAISNVQNSQSLGIVISVEVTPESQQICNNSPVFTSTIDASKRPNIRICAGLETTIDFSAIDNDLDTLGNPDRLVYKFCQPVASGGVSGSPGNPCPAGNPNCVNDCIGTVPLPARCQPNNFRGIITTGMGIPGMTIDENTGLISGTPTNITGIYLLAVCVEEYRYGELIGEIRRDFQFEVVACPLFEVDLVNSSIPISELLQTCQGSDYESCGLLEVKITNETEVDDRELRDKDIFWEWDIDIRGDTVTNTTEWEPTIEFPGLGRYWVRLIVMPGEICADTCEQFVNVTAEIAAKFVDPILDDCSQSVVFLDASESILPEPNFNVRWDFGDGTFLEDDHTLNPSILTPVHEYSSIGFKDVTLTVTKDDCIFPLTKQLAFFPLLDIDVIPSKFVSCAFTEVTFDSLARFVDDTYQFSWDFGDGNTSDELRPEHRFDDVGIWPVTLEIESPAGCSGRFTVAEIEVLPGPQAAFTAPDFVDDINDNVQFNDTSTGAETYLWDFGDGNTSTLRDPIHSYGAVGQYDVSLTVTSSFSDCQDVFTKEVQISVPSELEFPNAFTPDGDGNNDLFFGVKLVPNLGADFILEIYDRWGEMVFESTALEDGWNGQKFNTGGAMPIGVYVYKVKFTNLLGDSEVKKGTFLLLK